MKDAGFSYLYGPTFPAWATNTFHAIVSQFRVKLRMQNVLNSSDLCCPAHPNHTRPSGTDQNCQMASPRLFMNTSPLGGLHALAQKMCSELLSGYSKLFCRSLSMICSVALLPIFSLYQVSSLCRDLLAPLLHPSTRLCFSQMLPSPARGGWLFVFLYSSSMSFPSFQRFHFFKSSD